VTARPHRIAIALLAVALTGCASVPPEAPQLRRAGDGRVEVEMTGFENDEGQARIALYLGPEGWPDGGGSVFATTVTPISGGRAVAVFDGVPAGPFAVSVFHDADDDRELDTGVFGIPSEGYGFSADARGTFGPPSFEQARLDLAAGETMRITIEVR
jgi:uncharacterized protein (DUF2141 family)